MNTPDDGKPPSYPRPITGPMWVFCMITAMAELSGSWDPRGPFVFSAKGWIAVLVVALGIMLAAGVAVCAVWAVV